MSRHRENVIWKGRDGTWSRGFFECYPTGGDDPEWDVEYDYSRFDWCSCGHATEDDAQAAWHGANPGGCTIHSEPDADTDEFDRMAARYFAEKKNACRSSATRGT